MPFKSIEEERVYREGHIQVDSSASHLSFSLILLIIRVLSCYDILQIEIIEGKARDYSVVNHTLRLFW